MLRVCPKTLQVLPVDHVDVDVDKKDAIVDRAGRGDVVDYRTWP